MYVQRICAVSIYSGLLGRGLPGPIVRNGTVPVERVRTVRRVRLSSAGNAPSISATRPQCRALVVGDVCRGVSYPASWATTMP